MTKDLKYLCRFDTIPECDGQTDEQNYYTNIAVCVASHAQVRSEFSVENSNITTCLFLVFIFFYRVMLCVA